MKLRHIAEIQNSNVDKVVSADEIPVRLCNYVDVYKNDFITNEIKFTTGSASSVEISRFRLDVGDVVITKDSEDRHDIGVPALVRETADDLVCGYHLTMLRAIKDRTEGEYLFWALQSKNSQEAFAVAANGVTRYGLTQEGIKGLNVWVPDLPCQKRIAAFLDRETARIDALIAKKERLIAVLAQNQFSAISSALTVGLDAAAEKLATGSKYIPQVPKGWTVWRLKHLARAYGGITLGRKIKKDETTIPTPYLRVANVQAGRLDLTNVAELEATHSERERYALRKGDVLMNEGGDNDKLGRGAVWHAPFEPCLNQNHVFVVRPHDLRFSEWISMATNARYARDFFYLHSNQSTNLASISKTNLEKLPIAVPPMDEMLATMEALTARLTVMRKTEQTTRESIHRLREYRTALITAAVTGQIDVETYDRTTQPEADMSVVHLHDEIATRVQPDRRKLRTLVAAEVIHRHGSRARLGRIKMQKLMFLAEVHANVNDIAGSYQRYRHGPYDADMVAEIERSLREAGYYDATEIASSSGRKIEYC